jgi:hypothetical protein
MRDGENRGEQGQESLLSMEGLLQGQGQEATEFANGRIGLVIQAGLGGGSLEGGREGRKEGADCSR